MPTAKKTAVQKKPAAKPAKGKAMAPAGKSSAKASSKPAVKAAAKPPAKPATKPAATKPAAKPVSVNSVAPAKAPPSAKPAVSPAPKKTASPVASPDQAGVPTLANMSLETVMDVLRKLGTEANQKDFRRLGAADPVFGVSSGQIEALSKQIKVNHPLACALWATGNFDAMNLASRVADPSAFTAAQLDRWATGVRSYPNADGLSSVTARTQHAMSRVKKWISSDKEYIRRSGYGTLCEMLSAGVDADDASLLEVLGRIEKEAADAPNRAKERMVQTIVAIGAHRKSARKAAAETAAKIGKVTIDQGGGESRTIDAAAELSKQK